MILLDHQLFKFKLTTFDFISYPKVIGKLASAKTEINNNVCSVLICKLLDTQLRMSCECFKSRISIPAIINEYDLNNPCSEKYKVAKSYKFKLISRYIKAQLDIVENANNRFMSVWNDAINENTNMLKIELINR
jgi:hypothetical protein